MLLAQCLVVLAVFPLLVIEGNVLHKGLPETPLVIKVSNKDCEEREMFTKSESSGSARLSTIIADALRGYTKTVTYPPGFLSKFESDVSSVAISQSSSCRSDMIPTVREKGEGIRSVNVKLGLGTSHCTYNIKVNTCKK